MVLAAHLVYLLCLCGILGFALFLVVCALIVVVVYCVFLIVWFVWCCCLFVYLVCLFGLVAFDLAYFFGWFIVFGLFWTFGCVD